MPIPIVAGLIAGAWALLRTVIVPLVFWILASIGIGFVTYQGMDLLFNAMQTEIQNRLGGLPADMVAILGLLKIDIAIQIIFASYVSALTFRGFTGGAKTVFRLKNPSA